MPGRPAGNQRRSMRWLVAGAAVLAVVTGVWLTSARPSRPPPRFWIRADATPSDVRPFESPDGDEIRGWRLGDFGCGSHGPWPSHLDVVSPPRGLRQVGVALGLAEDEWPFDEEWESAEPVCDVDGWIEYLWIPRVMPSDAVPGAALAGEWEDDSGGGRTRHVTFTLAPDGRLDREHSTTVPGSRGRWACLGDVVYLEWVLSWAPSTRVIEVRLVAGDGRTWRRYDNSLDVGRRR